MSDTIRNDKVQWERGGKPHVLRTFERLHANKLGAHWIWMALERIAAGESELDVLLDYGYIPEVPNKKPDAKALERAVMADRQRPCLYGVAGPCVHPKCLEAHYETLRSNVPGKELAATHPTKEMK